MKLRIALCGLLGAASLLVGANDEPQHVVGQKGKQFSVAALTIKRGEAIQFTNDDSVTHNVFSKSEVNPFNLKLQPPGDAQVVRFARPGKAVVRCAIHPMMRLEVTVEP
jgi:cytochrome c peroxidase